MEFLFLRRLSGEYESWIILPGLAGMNRWPLNKLVFLNHSPWSILKNLNRPETHIKLGHGIYTVPDLALILQLPQAKVRRWLNDFYNSRLGGKYKGKYSFGEGREKATNFHTLIEFYVFYKLRESNLSVRKILEAHEAMSKQLRTPYPFASSEVLTEGQNVFYSADDDTMLYANKSQQIVIRRAIETFCKKIDFSENKLAQRYWPLGKDCNIVVDPHHQFGQPVLSGTNINAAVIFSMYESGEPIESIGILYDLTEKQVKDAVALYQRKAAW